MSQSIRHAGRVSRRGVLAGGAAAALGLAAPAIAAGSEPIKIGSLNTFTGPQATGGIAVQAGMELYFDQINWTVAGRKIELIKEDDQFNPQIGLQKAKKFVEQDKVAMIAGPTSSGVAMALLNYVVPTKTFLVVSGAGTNAITRTLRPYVFRTSISTWQLSNPVAAWMHDNVGEGVVVSAADYAGGHDVIDAFTKPYEALGGKVLKEMYPPLGTTDYSPYLTDLKSLNPKATYNFYPGSDAIRFLQQYVQYGLTKTAPLVGFELIDEESLAAAGRSALGVVTAVPYTPALETPESRQFVAAFRAKYGKTPDHYGDYGYTAAAVIDRTLQATAGDTDKDKLSAAMVKVAFNAPRGPFRFDPKSHNPIQNIYLCRVDDIGGTLVNKDFKTFSEVQDPGNV
jgi:branched-chain amino acid transport system substrate-binding protein